MQKTPSGSPEEVPDALRIDIPKEELPADNRWRTRFTQPSRCIHGQDFKRIGYGQFVMVRGAPHANAATVFVKWFASRKGQEIYAREMLEPSLRTDVRQDLVPDHVIPRPGVKYDMDQYSEDWMLNMLPQGQKQLTEALGR